MRLATLIAATALVATPIAALPAAAAAETVVPVAKFTGVELHGGGAISIRQGPVQRVTVIEGDPRVMGFEVNSRGRLMISPCHGACWGPHRLRVEIETPELDAVAIFGGGQITAEGAFPAKSQVSAAIHGGGNIDIRDVPAQAATASIHGGGKIYVSAQNSLDASILGGGLIRYRGHPSMVNRSILGGGSISSGGE